MNSRALLNALRAAAEPTRLRLLAICADGELTVSEITRITGQSQPRISRHLKVLTSAGLLDRFRERHWVFYRVPTQGQSALLVKHILETLSNDDEAVALDRLGVQKVINARAKRVSGVLETAPDAEVEALHFSPEQELAISDAVLQALNGSAVGKLLDIGTGTGRMLRLLGQQSEEAVGVDISQNMLLVARTSLYQAGLTNCTVRHGDMYQLRFADGSFDTVSIDLVLHLAEQPGRVVREAARVLKPGGRIVILDRIDNTTLSESGLSELCEEEGLSCDQQTVLDTEDQTVLLLTARHRSQSIRNRHESTRHTR